MSKMLERVAKAIQDALEKPKYIVKISKVWECWDCQEDRMILASEIHSTVDTECDRLNALYTARKAVEALKLEEKQINWLMNDKDLKGFEEWNRNITAILA